MSLSDLSLVAGSASTAIFMASYLPMLVKAVRTRDLSSYSPMNLVLTNVGNVVHSAYVFSLPAGPVWALHSFYLVTSAMMLLWYLRYRRRARKRAHPVPATTDPTATRGGPDVERERFATPAAHPAERSHARRVAALAR